MQMAVIPAEAGIQEPAMAAVFEVAVPLRGTMQHGNRSLQAILRAIVKHPLCCTLQPPVLHCGHIVEVMGDVCPACPKRSRRPV
jgi:hypothetical protein